MDTKSTLLFVDDEPYVLDSLRRVFQESSYLLRFAESAERALEILSTEHIQLVVSDYRMPKMNGGEFLKLVSDQWPDTVRIILSGFADVSSVVAAINEGQIYKFISKPWDNEELRLIVQEGVERFWQQAALRELAEVAVAENNALFAPHLESLDRLRQLHTAHSHKTESSSILEVAFDLLPHPALVFYDNQLVCVSRGAIKLLDVHTSDVQVLADHPFVRTILDRFKITSSSGSFKIASLDKEIEVRILTSENATAGAVVVALLE